MAKDAFLDPKSEPREGDLSKRLGSAFDPVGQVLDSLRARTRSVTSAWKFSKTSGWYLVFDQGKKRLFYLFPKKGDFVFKMVFNDEALARIREGGFGKDIARKLDGAKKYSEGTLLELTRADFEPRTIVSLLEIKRGG